jgi:shikimate kinase
VHFPEKIFLTGFMGSGKSTHGKKLAKELGYRFIDLDSYIEDKENMSVQSIFSNFGEKEFRQKETQYLLEIILLNERMVVSLGGGTICFHNNINNILKSGLLVYIKMPAEALYERLKNSKKKRPLLQNKNDEERFLVIKTLLGQREPFYSKAHLTINGIDLKMSVLKESIISCQTKNS